MKKVISLLLVFILCISVFSTFACEEYTDEYGIMPIYQTDMDLIKKEIAGGTKYLSDSTFGNITREEIVYELSSHLNDNYYLNTVYHKSDWQSPNGDVSYNGKAGMNCCGFVCYVLRKCGMDTSTVINYIKGAKDHATETGNLPYDLISKASNYYELIKEAGLIAYSFNSKSEMLNSGKCAKGDIILMYVNSPYGLSWGEDNHIGYFWGDTSSEDKFWHSTTKNAGGNGISKITESTACYILIKIDESNVCPEIPAEFNYYKTVGKVAVKEGAGNGYNNVTTLEGNTEVKITAKEGYWYKVESEDFAGYLPAASLLPIDEPKETVPPETEEPEITPPEVIPPETEEPKEEENEFENITSGTIPMHRLYNPNSGEHFYTGSNREKNFLVSQGWQYEGVAFNSPVKGGVPVYRVYNPNSGDHHYTANASEKDMLVAAGWKYEGIAFNSAESTEVPQYRLWNPNADLGSHHYTSSAEEKEILIKSGWVDEGIGFYSSLK